MSPHRRSRDQDLIDDISRWMDAPDQQKALTNGSAHRAPSSPASLAGTPTDEQVIEKCRSKTTAPEFERLFDHGDTSAHGDNDSDADFALLGHLKFYTQDPEQLDGLMRQSALCRPKWDEGRAGRTWLRYSIDNALKDVGEVYDWERARGQRHRHSIYSSDGDGTQIRSISFANAPEPAPLKELWEGIIVEGWPALWFGGTGVTKSVCAMTVAQAIADETVHELLGRTVTTAPVMYADWELNPQVQGRRAYQIARGTFGRQKPTPMMRYMSTYGLPRSARQDFLKQVLAECKTHQSRVCFIDSVGLAVSGNPGDFEVVVDFFDEAVASLTAEGITPILIDHQRRLAAGERNQSLGAYGSVWKENLSRTQLQIEFVRRDREAHTVTTRLRPKKTNFGELPEPLEVVTTFSGDAITLEAVDLEAADRAGEETLNAKERVLAAVVALGEGGPDAITEACQSLARTTVKNALSKLRKEGKVVDTDRAEPSGGRIVTVTGIYSSDGDGDATPLTHDQVREVLDNPEFFSGSAKALEHYLTTKTDKALEYLTRSVLRAYDIDTEMWARSAGVVRNVANRAEVMERMRGDG